MVVRGQCEGLHFGLMGGRCHELVCLNSYRRTLSGTLSILEMGDRKMEGKYWVKTCMALLAEIIFQRLTEEILCQYY